MEGQIENPKDDAKQDTQVLMQIADECTAENFLQFNDDDTIEDTRNNDTDNGGNEIDRNCAIAKADWLEQSWRGLADFNHMHVGRICSGDEMDTLMELVKQLSVVKEDDDEDLCDNTSPDFIIPELPVGTKLTFTIKSTWGDPHYVGLNGIEIFGSNGQLVSISSVTADPCDMRSLPEFSNDPRVITNLVDGVYKTRDDTHLWLAPFATNKDHFIYITMNEPTAIAMIRIWNYNKSRIHSFRGVRNMQILLDNVPIFKGEIAKAPGVQDTDTENLSDVCRHFTLTCAHITPTNLVSLESARSFILDDESYFTLSHSTMSGNDGFYTSDISSTPANVKYSRKKKFEGKVLVWIAIGPKGLSHPLIRKSGYAINAQTYLRECIRRRLIPYIRANYDQGEFVFWPDQASAHYAKTVLDHLRTENIDFVEKQANPANVPEIRPVEDFWSYLKRLVYAQGWEAKNTDQLINRIKYCLKKVDKNVVQKLALSTKGRIDAVRRSGVIKSC